MTEEYGHISDAFDNLPEEELLMMDFFKRGNEWLTIQNLDDEYCLWLYGEGVVGNGRAICPIKAKQSQIEAHMSKGWVRCKGL